MSKTCENCGREITIMIFKGGRWCSENCRKILLGKVKCSYGSVIVRGVQFHDVCEVHRFTSKYGPEKGPHRPCLAVEPY